MPATIGAAFDSYGANSGVSLTSSTGSITVNTLTNDNNGRGNVYTLFSQSGTGTGNNDGSSIFGLVPANLSVTALTGDIDFVSGDGYSAASLALYPSATGELSLVAGGSINGRHVR